ncbi:MAG: sugar kinase [Planctomycetota bacterium]
MPDLAFDKIVVVTRKTALEELIERYNSEAQARFYIELLGDSFDGYASAHQTFKQSLDTLNRSLPEVRCQWIDRSFLPNFLFGPKDLVLVVGQDGLVVNTAKYLDGQPLVAFNPDPTRIDGVLLPFSIQNCESVLASVMAGRFEVDRLTMARAALNNGQSIDALNDLFVGYATHASARYRISYGEHSENQSSSGIIITTGAGSTGWSRSILTGSAAIIEATENTEPFRQARESYRFDYRAESLAYYVREPFISRASQATLVTGTIQAGQPLIVTSQMPSGGVIFSDGVEQDFLPFDSGTTATISIAERKLNLVVKG